MTTQTWWMVDNFGDIRELSVVKVTEKSLIFHRVHPKKVARFSQHSRKRFDQLYSEIPTNRVV